MLGNLLLGLMIMVICLLIQALLFVALGEFSDLGEAVYHSGVNFATLGYGDIVMSEKHRLLGALEAVNGVLMVGVTTAVIMTAMQHAVRAARARRA